MGVSRRGKVYYMDFHYTDPLTGERRREYRSCRTTVKREAREREALRRAELEGRLGAPGVTSSGATSSAVSPGIALSAAIERTWVEQWSTQADGLKPYNRLNSVLDSLGDRPIAQVDHRFLQQIKTHLTRQGKQAATINRYLAALRTVLLRASRVWGLSIQVPAFELAKEHNGRLKVVSPEEEATLIKWCLSKDLPRYADLFVFLVDTGVRLGEALAVEYGQNLDLEESVIHLYADQTKSAKPRSIPMTSRVARICRSYCVHGSYESCVRGRLFPFTVDQVQGVWRRFRRDLGITEKGYVIHALRHTCASRLVQRGVDLYTVSAILGHASINVTQRYAHLAQSGLKAAMQVLESDADAVAPKGLKIPLPTQAAPQFSPPLTYFCTSFKSHLSGET